MLLSNFDEDNLSIDDINNILFTIPEDDLKNGDCIWVFCSRLSIDERLEVAVKLFKDNRAPFILFSGGKGKNGVVAEAKIMKEKAISLGIPEEAILTEEESYNTTENVLCSMLVLERKFLLQNIKRLIIVSSPYHIQRLILTISRYMPRWIDYSFCYDEDSPTSRKNWLNDPIIKKRVEKEANGIVYYAKNKYIDDKEITI